ncbi:hypothetical protein ACJ6WF_11885 [Streptomyces sp. MMS24-I2-30]|uniref:hypothetical protein n=1 Tax=Streptomyces sp. MMS24-I2-30 TaxID=3351564 RepID=UPI003896D650
MKDENLLQSVAKDVYKNYQLSLGWPEKPPAGLRVALAWPSLGLSGWKPVVVDVPQPESGPSDASVPSLIADPSLDLRDFKVSTELLNVEGVDEQVCMTASRVQNHLKSLLGDEAFGEDAQPGYSAPMFDGLNVDKIWADLTAGGLGGVHHGAGAASLAPGYWSGPDGAVAADVSGYGGYAPAGGAAQPSWGDPVAYSPWGNPYGEGASRSAAYPPENASLVPQGMAYLRSAPPADWSAGTQGNDEPVAPWAPAHRPGRSQGR